MEQVIRTSLVDKFPVANTMPFDRLISTEQGEREGHERARALLKDSDFDVMVWGDCLKTPMRTFLDSLELAREKPIPY